MIARNPQNNTQFCISALPPPVSPPFLGEFRNILKLLSCDVMIHLMSVVISRTESSPSSCWSELQFEKVGQLFSHTDLKIMQVLQILTKTGHPEKTLGILIGMHIKTFQDNLMLCFWLYTILKFYLSSLQILHIIGIALHEEGRAHEAGDDTFKFIEKATSGKSSQFSLYSLDYIPTF